MSRGTSRHHSSSARAVRRFGFRQTIRGALIIGVLGGLMMGAQGAAYAEAYPDQHSRDMLMISLENTPALGFMAGEVQTAATPASYSIYKSIALMTLLTAVWALLVSTRLLRGQEEDGRLESIVAGTTTKWQASAHLLVGFGYSILIAFVVTCVCIAALGAVPSVSLTPHHTILLTLGVFLPGVFFASLGVLTSQLAMTRGRALAYGLVPLLAFFTIRGAANSITDWNWLKQFSPFGWTDLLNPVLDPQPQWIIPTMVFAAVCIPLGLYLAARRDLGGSILPQSTFAKSRFYLLGSTISLAIRQNIWTFIWWCLGTLAYAGLLAAIAKLGADIIGDSPMVTQIIASMGGGQEDLIAAFIGFGGMFTAMILLVMTAVTMNSIRNDEAKGYLDNLLVHPVRRSSWLIQRLVLIVVMIGSISVLASYVMWVVSAAQGIALDLEIMLQNAIALLGTIILTLGIGTFLYGVLPRIAVASMYIVIVWAFVVDVLKSLLSLDDWIDKTSLFHYVSFAPNEAPDWSMFAWLVGIGTLLMAIGIIAFTRRDVTPE